MNVLLDLDGTLTDPRQGIVACIRYALSSLALPSPDDRDLERFIGPPLQQSFALILGAEHRHRVNDAVALYRERFSAKGMFENAVYPGIAEALAQLCERGARLHVATSKPLVYAERIVEHFGLSGFFRSIHGSELDGSRSDKGELIAHLLRAEGVSRETALMVGDRAQDVIGARANGLPAVGVLWGYGSREELKAAGSRWLCEQPLMLAEAVMSVLGVPRAPVLVAGDVAIRRAASNEPWAEITALLHRAYATHAARGLRFHASYQDAEVTRERAGEGECYLAVVKENIVGTVTALPCGRESECEWYTRADTASMGQLAVEPAFQQRGIGTLLMDLAEERARGWGARRIAIDTSEHATGLIALYRRRGYEIVDSIRWPVTNYRSVIMAKSLISP